MALCMLDGSTALTSLNKNRKWPSVGRQGSETLNPIARPYYSGFLTLETEDCIATFGSCFAVNILHALPASLKVIRIPEHYEGGGDSAKQQYNVFSILNQMKWGFGELNEELSYSAIFPTGKNNFYKDCHGKELLWSKDRGVAPEIDHATSDLETVTESRRILNQELKNIQSANFFIVTLGMAEVWYDRETGLYLNEMPPPLYIKKYPQRFQFRQLDYNEILEALNEIYALLSRHKTDFKLIVTVSPVPYQSSFTPTAGAICSNTYSKSVQRAAVEGFVSQWENVAYFPSYEMATLSNNYYVWCSDEIHVLPQFVHYIMSHFLASLASDELKTIDPSCRDERVDEELEVLLSQRTNAEALKRDRFFFANAQRLINPLQKIIDTVSDKETLAIWGAGDILRQLLDQTNLVDKQIVAIFDRNILKDQVSFLIGRGVDNVPLVSPERIHNFSCDKVLIASRSFADEIESKLIHSGFCRENIVRLDIER